MTNISFTSEYKYYKGGFILLNILRRKRWANSEHLIHSYDDCFEVDYGVTWINPQEIICLSLNPRKVRSDEKMGRLRNSVASNGWTNEHPVTLHLYRLPNGKLTVGAGGNHRAYLSKELKIPRIRALVTIMIPATLVTEDQKIQLENLKQKEREFDMKAKEVNAYLNTKGAFRDMYESEEAQLDEFDELATLQHEYRKKCLLEIADSLNYIPKQ